MQEKKKKEQVDVKKKTKKKGTLFTNYVHQRIFKENKNFLMIIVGGVGTGKSYSALRLCEQLDDSFTSDRCCFKALNFMRKIKEFQDLAKEEHAKIKGKALMWDELGVEHNAREFMTKSNRIINYFFQTGRYMNLVIVMTVPYLSYIDSATRKLAFCIAETQDINHRKKTVKLRIKFQQVNPFTSKEYPKYLRYDKNGLRKRIEVIRVHMPSPELAEPYEINKAEYLAGLCSKNIAILERDERKEEQSLKPQERKPLTDTQEKVMRVLANIKESNKYEVASKKLGISLSTIHQNKTLAEKKGYTLEEFKENDD